jgi:hypothetical protein
MSDLDPKETTVTPPGDFRCAYCNDGSRVAHLPIVSRVTDFMSRQIVLTFQCPRCHSQYLRTTPMGVLSQIRDGAVEMDLTVAEGGLGLP